MALVAHIDSGKTTLTESLLYRSSYLSTSGTVDTGSTTTDFLPAERERGITIQSASIPVKWKNWTFNLIDTPGHADFGMEVESASRVVDGAVVLIDSVEGVEAQTKGVWKQLDRYGVGTRIMFLNKLDRTGASFHSSMLSLLAHRLHPKPVALTLPIASFEPENYARAEPGIEGLVDLVKWQLWRWDDGGNPTVHSLPTKIEDLEASNLFPKSHPIVLHLAPARMALLDNLSMFSEKLMETLLGLPQGSSSYLSITPSAIIPHIRAATMREEILPVLCGAAAKNIGTELVLDYVGELLASPVDVRLESQSATAPLRMLAWKVMWDKRKGWMTFVRVYSGTVKGHDPLLNVNQNQKERCAKLLLLYASDAQEVKTLSFGDVGVILGLQHTRTGDTLVSACDAAHVKSTASMRDIVPPPPVMSTAIVPQSQSDLQPVQDALQALARTDPSVRVDVQEGQLLAHGLGSLHLEIVEGRLREEWGVRFETGKRHVSYREGLTPDAEGLVSETWSTVIGANEVGVSMSFKLRPLKPDEAGDDQWDGNVVLDMKGQPIPSADTLASQLSATSCIARGVASALSNSAHTSLPLSRIFVQVLDANRPHNAPLTVLTGVSHVILQNHLRAAGMGPLFEPYIRVKVAVNEDSLGNVVKDLTEHAGEVVDLASGSGILAAEVDDELGPYPTDGVYVPPEWMSPSSASSSVVDSLRSSPRQKRVVHATAPLSQMVDYSNRLRAQSGGHGVFEMSNAGFRQVSESRKMEILRELGRA